MNVFDYFFTQSKRMNKKFILNEEENISFRELYERSIYLAFYLSVRWGENNKIILISHNSVFFIVSYLAIIKSGNVCVPLNPAVENENYSFIEQSTDCQLSFISDKVKTHFTVKGEVINEGTQNLLIENLKGTDIQKLFLTNQKFDENRLAEILFTSGSTGIPKGVMLTHLNLRANTESIISYLKLTSSDSNLLVLPLFYCYGLSVFHTHLKAGASLVFNNNFILLGSVIDNLIKYKCSGFAGVPSHFQLLLRKSETFKKTHFPHLRYVTQAGGKLHDSFVEEFCAAFPNVEFFVMYGQTEATARLTYLPPSLVMIKQGSIGIPIPGITLTIVDEEDNPVKVGDIGEIIVKGDNIMKGYYNDAIGTSETVKKGWLYTGDLGKMDEDGFVTLTARKKAILKIGGHRISSKEIEDVIVSIPQVIDCTVVAVEDELLGEAIKAKVVVNEYCKEDVLKNNILKLCRQKLCSNKIPKIIEFSLNLQVNSVGKKEMLSQFY